MKYIITERQYRLLTEEPEDILEIPFKFFNDDWDFLQEYLNMIGNPPYKLIGDLDLYGSDIKSLENLQSVGGWLYLRETNIKSLGNLQHVGGDLILRYSNIKYLGNLQSVGGYLNLTATPLSEKTTEEEIRKQVDVKGDIYL